VVIKVLKALIRTEMFIQSNPEEARSLAVELLGIEKADINNIWASFDFKVVLDQMLIKSLEDQTRWAQKNRFTDNMKMPNYLDFIYFDGLQSIRPESVRIIR
jgi:NitT/TauT family transport system substrate-binding protein